jgi:LuxR family maltose regulon positive regulatory protein
VKEPSPVPLLRTKLQIPRIQREQIKRPRITELLDHATQYPLTLVSSLAGSGKTTALVEWINQCPGRAAWFSIDEGDNDLNRFLLYFVTALQTIAPGTGSAILEAVRSTEQLSVESMIALLVNDIPDTTNDFYVVLDDYHLITSHAIHKALSFLIEHAPNAMHLVISTRADPGLPLARFRARNRVLELRMDQLRFTPAEAAEYMNQVMQLGLSKNDLDALQVRTEGWIASLQLAALSLKGQPDASSFIQAFSGSNRYLLDYLVEEVLTTQPDQIQSFLLQTSILDRMCGALCDSILNDGVTGNEHGQQTLEHLDRANLFLVPLDHERKWYRYHHLFRDLLRARLSHDQPATDIENLHLRAADWYEKNGFFEEAIRHALAAQDFPRAARLVEGIAESLWLNGYYTTLIEWIRSIPGEVVRSHPWLCVWNGWAFTQMGLSQVVQRWVEASEQAQVVQQWIEAAEQAAGLQDANLSSATVVDASRDNQALMDEIAALRVFAISFAQDYDRATELAENVLKKPPPKNKRSAQFVRCNILHVLSTMYYVAGELLKTEQTCQETIELAKEIGFTLRHIHAVSKLALVDKTTGRLYRSYRLLEETLLLLQEQGLHQYFAASQLRYRLIGLLYEWDRLDEFQRLVEFVTQLEPRVEAHYLLVDFYNIQALDLLFQQDYTAAQTALNKAMALARQTYIWQGLTWRTETLQVRLWLQKGEVSLAAAWASEQAADPPGILPFSSESRTVARARILLAQGKYSQAIPLLDRLSDSAQSGGRKGSLIEIRALKAIALHSAGDLSQAAAELESALALAEPEGYIRTFVDEGSPMAALLAHIVQENRSAHLNYALRLLVAFEKEPGSASPVFQSTGSPQKKAPLAPTPASTALIEPLSRRELEVLCCMAEGLSNSETARRLVIETSTVKRHINSIFAKLGVNNRVQALNKAKESGLLL